MKTAHNALLDFHQNPSKIEKLENLFQGSLSDQEKWETLIK